MTRKSGRPRLAIDGGPKTIAEGLPPRGLITVKEKQALAKLFDKAIATGQAIGYNGPEEENYCLEFAKTMGGGYADAVNSGTTAL